MGVVKEKDMLPDNNVLKQVFKIIRIDPVSVLCPGWENMIWLSKEPQLGGHTRSMTGRGG